MQRLLLALTVLLIFVSAVLADEPITAGDNNPHFNDEANACFPGGSLYPTCNTTDLNGDKKVDREEVNYMYTAGWYVIRYDTRLLNRNQVPSMYWWLLRPEPTQPTACYTSNRQDFIPFTYTGVANQRGNITSYLDAGGDISGYYTSCETPRQVYLLIVTSDAASARALCDATYGPYARLDHSIEMGYSVPADWWECYIFP